MRVNVLQYSTFQFLKINYLIPKTVSYGYICFGRARATASPNIFSQACIRIDLSEHQVIGQLN